MTMIPGYLLLATFWGWLLTPTFGLGLGKLLGTRDHRTAIVMPPPSGEPSQIEEDVVGYLWTGSGPH